MAYETPTVLYQQGVGLAPVLGVQSVVISRGRQRFQDNVPASQCTIELIPAATYVTPFEVGNYITVSTQDELSYYFNGTITDVDRTYAFPYDGGTGYAPEDRITITATGGTGAVGANNLTSYTAGGIVRTANDALDTVSTQVGVAFLKFGVGSFVDIAVPSFTGGALDYVNEILRAGQMSFDDSEAGSCWYYTTGSRPQSQATITFTDNSLTTVGSSLRFNAIDYASSVQNSFTQVSVRTGVLTGVASSGSAPYNTLVYDTPNNSQSDVDSLANYILTVNNQDTAVPFTITSNTDVAPLVLELALLFNGSNRIIIGAPVSVIFRGTTVLGAIQGIRTVFTPTTATVQLYLSPALSQPFTLDSTAFGVLDTNRLGYP